MTNVRNGAGPGPPDESAREVLVSLRDASFGYGDRPVISHVNLTVRRGDFLGIVGPNGAGKTTLLRGIIGFSAPLAGEVLIGSAAGRHVVLGYVPQVQSLDSIFPLTVTEVVAMGAYPRLRRLRLFGGEERAVIGECLRQVGMERVSRKLFSELSAGQKQRVLVARALVSRPDLLLLDEPTSGADEAAEQAIMQVLGRLNREDLAIVLVCHEMDTLRENVREVVWVHHGRVEQGSVSEMLSPTSVKTRLGGEGESDARDA
ncbi:MAG: metal ABC transporter ATP-binding protein [Planctomycetota bacterium]